MGVTQPYCSYRAGNNGSHEEEKEEEEEVHHNYQLPYLTYANFTLLLDGCRESHL